MDTSPVDEGVTWLKYPHQSFNQLNSFYSEFDLDSFTLANDEQFYTSRVDVADQDKFKKLKEHIVFLR